MAVQLAFTTTELLDAREFDLDMLQQSVAGSRANGNWIPHDGIC